MGKWLLALIRVVAPPKTGTETASSCDSVYIDANQSKRLKSNSIKKRRWSFGSSTRRANVFQGAQIATKLQNSAPAKRKNTSAASYCLTLHSVASIDIQPNKEEKAASTIQRTFRGFLARRNFRALKASIRLKSLLREDKVSRQTRETLRGVQAFVKVQAHVRAIRTNRSERNTTIQRQIWHRRQQERRYIKALREGPIGKDDWNLSSGGLEEAQIRLERKKKGSISRERAMEYAWSHQLSQQYEAGKATIPHWDWNWSSSWLSPRPWDSCIPCTKSVLQRAIPLEVLTEKTLGSGIYSSRCLSSSCLLARYKCGSIATESSHTLEA